MRGDIFKLIRPSIRYDLRMYSSSKRIIPVWNSLPDRVVSAEIVCRFKNVLEMFWSLRNFKYDWSARIPGTGSNSKLQSFRV